MDGDETRALPGVLSGFGIEQKNAAFRGAVAAQGPPTVNLQHVAARGGPDKKGTGPPFDSDMADPFDSVYPVATPARPDDTPRAPVQLEHGLRVDRHHVEMVPDQQRPLLYHSIGRGGPAISLVWRKLRPPLPQPRLASCSAIM